MPPPRDAGSHGGRRPTMTRAMQSSVVLALTQVTFPLLCALHCWHLLSSWGPTAHHRTRARRLSASSAATQRDTAITGGPGPRQGRPGATDLLPARAPRPAPLRLPLPRQLPPGWKSLGASAPTPPPLNSQLRPGCFSFSVLLASNPSSSLKRNDLPNTSVPQDKSSRTQKQWRPQEVA